MSATLTAGRAWRGARGGGARGTISAVWRIGEGRVGLVLLAFVLFVILLGPALAPGSPTETGAGAPLAGPSADHLLGADQLGRDVLSRLLHGGRSVLLVPLAGTFLALALGGVVGMSLGYLGGRVDAVASRCLDVLLALPPLLTVLVIIAAFGGGTSVLVISVGLVYSPKIARVVRGATQDVRARDFVQAAQLRGEGLGWVLGRELLPNLSSTLLVEAAVRITFAIVFVATLNFLGLGVQPPEANWGLMVAEGRGVIVQAPLIALAPALAIALLVVSIHLLADALGRVLGEGRRTEADLP